ncbi:MAG: hypothetical protein P0S94_04520, partial [Simkaniaceae bacterium]|nr:hypothetical protein [Simkaniaceae bacterium]
LSDLMGSRKKIMYFGTICAFFMSYLVIYVTLPVWLLNVFLFGFGFFISGFLVCFTMIREISAPAVAATAIGFMNAFDALLGALSEPLTGWFLDLGWRGEMLNGGRIFPVAAYQKALATLPIYLFIASIILIFIKETYKKDEIYPSTMP